MNANNQTTLLIFLVAGLIGFAWWNFKTAPLRQDLANVRETHAFEERAADQRIADGQRAEARYDELRATVEDGEARYQELLETLPTRRRAGELIDEISTHASREGMTLESITPTMREETFGQDIAYLPVEVSVQGTFPNTMAFLRALENLDRFAAVVDVRVSRDNGDWQDPLLRTDATLRIYLYRGTR